MLNVLYRRGLRRVAAARVAVAEAGLSTIEVLGVVACLLILLIMLIPNVIAARQQTQVAACESNLRAIQTAAELYYSATQTYPTGTGVAATVALFTNPNVATAQYLPSQPVDPADPTGRGTYSYTYTAPTATTPFSYVISCPGIHPKETLAAVQGGATETTGHIYIDSSKNIYTQ
jgi:type II secretory pathway pseudopilin PulG